MVFLMLIGTERKRPNCPPAAESEENPKSTGRDGGAPGWSAGTETISSHAQLGDSGRKLVPRQASPNAILSAYMRALRVPCHRHLTAMASSNHPSRR